MKKTYLSSLLILAFHIGFGQSLSKRWNQMLDQSSTYKSHKVIKEGVLMDMWNVMQDSLQTQKMRTKLEQKKVADQKATIANLEERLKEANGNLKTVTQEKGSVQASIERTDTYILTLWITIGVLVSASIFLFLLYKRGNALTSQKKEDYDELLKSFEEYKATKLEVERKLKREMQTYMNKLEEMKVKKIGG